MPTPVSVVAAFLAAGTLAAAAPATPPAAPIRPTPVLTGSERVVPYTKKTNLLALAQKHAASPQTLRRLNKLDSRRRRPKHLVVSTRAIAPRPFADGVVINLPAFRLFRLQKGVVVGSWPVALGRDFDREWKNKTRWRTPIGTFKVRAKYWHPDWIVPKDLQKELKVPREIVPFGDPEYPLGEAKIQLTATGLNIHGTYAPHSIGKLASHGCIRMWNHAITELYRSVKVGTPVALVYAPVQVVEDGDRVWLEVNRDIYKLAGDLQERALTVIQGAGLARRVDPALVARAVSGTPGIAVDVTRSGSAGLVEAAATRSASPAVATASLQVPPPASASRLAPGAASTSVRFQEPAAP